MTKFSKRKKIAIGVSAVSIPLLLGVGGNIYYNQIKKEEKELLEFLGFDNINQLQ